MDVGENMDEGGNMDVTSNAVQLALRNELVLEEIFGHLDLWSIKKCRMVNQKWRSVASSRLVRRVIHPMCTCNVRNKKVNPPASQKEWNCILIKTDLTCKCFWDLESFSAIFETYKDCMIGLVIKRDILCTDRIEMNVPSWLTKLTVCGSSNHIIFPIKSLENIKFLTLGHMEVIDLNDFNTHIIPLKLDLNGTKFVYKTKGIIVLNNFFAFHEARSIRLENLERAQLDMSQYLKVDRVKILSTKIVQNSQINWEMDYFVCKPICSHLGSDMSNAKIKSLILQTRLDDLRSLPKKVQAMNVWFKVSQDINLSVILRQVNFSNLRSLTLNYFEDFSLLTKVCPNLEILEFHSPSRTLYLKIDSFLVKTLILNGNVCIDNDTNVSIERLILKDVIPAFAQAILNRILSNHVVVNFKQYRYDENVEPIVHHANMFAYGSWNGGQRMYTLRNNMTLVKEISAYDFEMLTKG